jgi:hypothetical protein
MSTQEERIDMSSIQEVDGRLKASTDLKAEFGRENKKEEGGW